LRRKRLNARNSFSGDLSRKAIIPFDTLGIISTGTLPNELKNAIKDKIEVHYANSLTSLLFYRDVSSDVSWLEVKGGYVRVNKDGTLLNPTEVIISGDMSLPRVASMLPIDYSRTKLISIKKNQPLRVKQLQEKVYVQTDKPYYYGGETIWLSAFMNYRSNTLADTLSKVLYVDLINPEKEIVQSLVLKIDSGRQQAISKPQKNKTRHYFLRAYTQWMRNYGVDYFFTSRCLF